MFAQQFTKELANELGVDEGPILSPIPEVEEDSEGCKYAGSAQRELDNISREPQEFEHPILAYQSSKSNQLSRRVNPRPCSL